MHINTAEGRAGESSGHRPDGIGFVSLFDLLGNQFRVNGVN
jgi:hypothetical protein